jgi:hypothetical protein
VPRQGCWGATGSDNVPVTLQQVPILTRFSPIFNVLYSSVLRHRVQTSFGTHPASSQEGTRGSFLGIKRRGVEADHSPPSSVEVKNAWSYTSTPPIRLHGVVLS